MSDLVYTPRQMAKMISVMITRAKEENYKYGGVFICLSDGNYFEAHDFYPEQALFQFIHNASDMVTTLMVTPYDQIASFSMSQDAKPKKQTQPLLPQRG